MFPAFYDMLKIPVIDIGPTALCVGPLCRPFVKIGGKSNSDSYDGRFQYNLINMCLVSASSCENENT